MNCNWAEAFGEKKKNILLFHIFCIICISCQFCQMSTHIYMRCCRKQDVLDKRVKRPRMLIANINNRMEAQVSWMVNLYELHIILHLSLVVCVCVQERCFRTGEQFTAQFFKNKSVIHRIWVKSEQRTIDQQKRFVLCCCFCLCTVPSSCTVLPVLRMYASV